MENKALSDRGFLGGTFTDNYGKECSIQESSACASNDDEGWYIWLGIDKPDVYKDLLSGPSEKVILPDNYVVFSRMHLSQKRVGELIPHLMYFAQTGSLPNAEQHAHFAEFLGDQIQPLINDYFNDVSN